MNNKRIIFSLLYSRGYFYLSRNFRLQKVGNVNWIKHNYNFGETCNSIDELIIILVTPNPDMQEINEYFNNVKILKKNFFVPLTLGGGIRTFEHVKKCFDNGADKVLINTIFFDNKKLVDKISYDFGNQAVSLMIDYKNEENFFYSYKNCGRELAKKVDKKFFSEINNSRVGEVIFNSIDKDGNAAGLDENFIKKFTPYLKKPFLAMGGAGKPEHIINVLKFKSISGVITANLFNFLGTGLNKARNEAIKNNIPLAIFNGILEN